MPAARAHNPEIAQSLDDIADLLELEEANAFRVRAYRNAARVVRSLGREVSEVLDKSGARTLGKLCPLLARTMRR